MTNKVVMHTEVLDEMNKKIMRGVRDLTELLRGVCDEHSPKGETGLLAGAHETMYDDVDMSGYILNETEYGKYVHWGTKPYYIRIIPYIADEKVIKALGNSAVWIKGQVWVPVFIGWVRKVLGIGDEVEAYKVAWSIHRKVRAEGFQANPWMLDSVMDFLQHDNYFKIAFPDYKVVML